MLDGPIAPPALANSWNSVGTAGTSFMISGTLSGMALELVFFLGGSSDSSLPLLGMGLLEAALVTLISTGGWTEGAVALVLWGGVN